MPNVRERTREPKKASWRLLIVFSCNVCDRLLWAKCAAIRDAVGEAWLACGLQCGVATSKLLGAGFADCLQLFLRPCRHPLSLFTA
jgi:hypothetical protein